MFCRFCHVHLNISLSASGVEIETKFTHKAVDTLYTSQLLKSSTIFRGGQKIGMFSPALKNYQTKSLTSDLSF